MKHILGRALAFAISLLAITGISRAQSAYTVTGRGPDYKILQKTTVEHGTNHLHRYVQIETGLNYTNSSGQLVESSDQITLLPTGGAVANQGRHTVSFPADIYNGVLTVTTPDGRILKSRPLGVSYDDGSNTVFIATLKSAQGYLTASNTVTYRDAFDGIKADLVCQYRRSGFECDLVLRQQPPTPDQYGLDNSFSTLQMVTEFFDTADPQQIPAASDDRYGLQDTTLKFGKLTMTHGKAFAFKGTNSASQTPDPKSQTPVYKSWVHSAGRTFLIESVPLLDIAEDLNALPLMASAAPQTQDPSRQTPNPKSQTLLAVSPIRHHSSSPVFPSLTHHGSLVTNQLLLATADITHEPGVVLDYNEIDSDQDAYTFASGTTYLISGPVNLSDMTTLQAGAILKFTDAGSLVFDYDDLLTCPDDVNNPAVLTSVDDSSIGDPIGSGSPSTGSATYFSFHDNSSLTQCALSNLDIYYAGTACQDDFEDGYVPLNIANCQFINCGTVFYSYAPQLLCNNALFSNCGKIIDGGGNYTVDVQATFTTVDNCGVFRVDAGAMGGTLEFTNSIVSSLGRMIELGSPDYDSYYTLYPYLLAQVTLQNTITTGSIGYQNIVSSTDGTSLSDASGLYETFATASYYLASGSAARDAGTADIDPGLLAAIQTMTTYTPPDGAIADTNTPDCGYHYPLNADYDRDGLADWWEWYWFQSYDHSSTNVDSAQNTLLSDYQNGLDPDVIQFSLQFPDNVNTNVVSGTVSVLGGLPASMAVLVNDTNPADATWETYSSSITVNLNTNDGIYNILVGLRGLAVSATPTWAETTVTVDTTPLTITVTDPGVTVSKPILQLQGYANKSLMTLTYDFTNTAGVWTNQDGFLTGHAHNTNQQVSATYFQCYDLLLANGPNAITLHATDMFGNQTITNLNVILDYSGATNPPSFVLAWPTNGTVIPGTNFVLQGTLDDATALVIVGSGTNNFIGSVARDGRFSVVGLTLSVGTNIFTIAATNLAGHGVSQTLTVIQSPVNLTLDPVSVGQLAGEFLTVSGTISDDSHDVYVNGVLATISGDPVWEADNVPVLDDQGMGQLNVAVYPPGSDPSITSPTATLNLPVTLPPIVQAQSYTETFKVYDTQNLLYTGTGWYQTAFTRQWSNLVGGFSVKDGVDDRGSESIITLFWPAYWPDGQLIDGIFEVVGGFTESYASATPSAWGNANLNINGAIPVSGGVGIAQRQLTRKASTEIQLVAGGPAQPGIFQLVRLLITAAAYKDNGMDGVAGFYKTYDQTRFEGTGDVPLPASAFQILGQPVIPTSTNAYVGEKYVLIPSGAVHSLPFKVTGTNNDNYSFAIPADNGLRIYDANNGQDLTTQTNVVIVGQQMNLVCQTVSTNGPTLNNFQWAVPEYALTNFYVSPDFNHTNGYPIPLTATNNQTVKFFWVDGVTNLLNATNRIVQCSATVNGKTVTARAIFQVVKPMAKITTWTSSVELGLDVNNDSDSFGICFGTNGIVGILFSNTIKLPAGTNFNMGNRSYSREWWQVVESPYLATEVISNDVGVASLTTKMTNGVVIDTRFPYGFSKTFRWPDTDDSPQVGLNLPDAISGALEQHSEMRLMFKPDGGNWVPLRVVSWYCIGSAHKEGSSWIMDTRDWSHEPTDADAGTSYPQWTDNYLHLRFK